MSTARIEQTLGGLDVYRRVVTEALSPGGTYSRLSSLMEYRRHRFDDRVKGLHTKVGIEKLESVSQQQPGDVPSFQTGIVVVGETIDAQDILLHVKESLGQM